MCALVLGYKLLGIPTKCVSYLSHHARHTRHALIAVCGCPTRDKKSSRRNSFSTIALKKTKLSTFWDKFVLCKYRKGMFELLRSCLGNGQAQRCLSPPPPPIHAHNNYFVTRPFTRT
mmetsp:Transcript_55919/g.67400  ORF Transcript_55919/g.67400 Transcript_55919/m.67400 type:complete len:117 (+) Transcript_55919:32-382(+)